MILIDKGIQKMQLGDDDKGRPVGGAVTLRSLFSGLPAEGVEELGPIRSEIVAVLSKNQGTVPIESDEFENIDLKGLLLERPDLCFRLATALSILYIDSVRNIGRHI
ncbi:MAG: hypothetical protein KA831_07105 [Pyrinomonadaceae bacterium]|nr:hypothetical protein [Pyrinomonadaceae bacterium]